MHSSYFTLQYITNDIDFNMTFNTFNYFFSRQTFPAIVLVKFIVVTSAPPPPPPPPPPPSTNIKQNKAKQRKNKAKLYKQTSKKQKQNTNEINK